MLTGDKAAFTDVYNEMKNPVFTIIFRIVGSRAEAEDIMQDLFLRLYRSSPPEKIRNPRAYVFMTARNMAIDSVRKPECAGLDDELPCDDALTEDYVSERADIDSALSSLSLAERETVTLHINGGMKFREISVITGDPLGTVLWRYNTAISKLKKLLSN